MHIEETSSGHAEHWYQLVEDQSLRQGDLFRDLSTFWVKEPTDNGTEAVAGVARGDFIVASASCDLENNGYDYVLLHRVFPADETTLRQSGEELQKAIEVIRRGLNLSRFLLSATREVTPELPLSFATSKQHALVSIAYLRAQCCRPRLRLRSPIRESYGSWVAACFGRVGVESEAQIPRVIKSLYPGTIIKHAED